jgi:5'-3' exonuclease
MGTDALLSCDAGGMGIEVHLVDGTYELFRHHFGMPSHLTAEGREVAATRGVVGTVISMLEGGATHIGVATDHVIESFRNDLWPGYKSSAGVPPELLDQFGLLESALEALGVVVFAMEEYEADDALAAAAHLADGDPAVDRVIICTPDKDLGQCVRGRRVVQLDRRKGVELDEAGVTAKFGVPPASIPDYLALVGDAADGFPGLPGWGAKSAAAVLARYGHLEAIPADVADWDGTGVRGAGKLAVTLRDNLELALLFRRIATLELDADVLDDVGELAWPGPSPALAAVADAIDAPGLLQRARREAERRGLLPGQAPAAG